MCKLFVASIPVRSKMVESAELIEHMMLLDCSHYSIIVFLSKMTLLRYHSVVVCEPKLQMLHQIMIQNMY